MIYAITMAAAEATGSLLNAFPVESIFGGAVLLGVLWLLLTGRLRAPREVEAKEDIIELHERTIANLEKTIDTLTSREQESLRMLRELRDVALRRGELDKEL